MTPMRLFALAVLASPALLAAEPRHLILTNGRVWTGDPARPRSEAVAAIGGRIVAVGSSAEIARWAGARTEIIDLAGKFVAPGFNDAHVHFRSGGENLSGVQLRDARSEAEFRERI